MHISIAATELHIPGVMTGDVSATYVLAYSQEKLFFIAGPESAPLKWHLLVIVSALYELCASGDGWNDRLSDVRVHLCYSDPEDWLKECELHYEYVLVNVDNPMHITKNPKWIFVWYINDLGFQLKDGGKPPYHLGVEFFTQMTPRHGGLLLMWRRWSLTTKPSLRTNLKSITILWKKKTILT
jgi:hypothetical protein